MPPDRSCAPCWLIITLTAGLELMRPVIVTGRSTLPVRIARARRVDAAEHRFVDRARDRDARRSVVIHRSRDRAHLAVIERRFDG